MTVEKRAGTAGRLSLRGVERRSNLDPAKHSPPGPEAGMSGFRPRLAPALFTLAVVLLCAALGVWQLHRLEWKRSLMAQREAALTASPVALPDTLAEARALEFP